MLSAKDIRHIKSLQQKKFRKIHGIFIAEGDRLVLDLIASSNRPIIVYHTTDWKLPQTDVKFQQISAKEMERISGLSTYTPALALTNIPSYDFNPEIFKGKLSLALEDIQDPGNLGTIIRLADWFGIENIICSKVTADAFSPKVVQATMGSITRVKIIYCDIFKALSEASEWNIPIFGTFLEGENIYEIALPEHGVIVLGNEGSGISKSIEKMVTQKLFIPKFSNTSTSCDSLNVAMAAAIVCSEFRRRLK